MERPTCKSCVHWDEGACRSMPPIPILLTKTITNVWSRTSADDWCGDHPDFDDYLTDWKTRRAEQKALLPRD